MSKWISVNESLPEDGSWVLIYASSEGVKGKITTMAFYEASGGEVFWLCHNDNEKDSEWSDVTHWQPLPNPPQQLS